MDKGISNLPFPRGRTMGDFGNGGVTLSSTSYLDLAGQVFVVPDTEHGTGLPMKVRVVKNGSSPLTVTRIAIKFGTAALNFGRVSGGANTVSGGVCKPIDDAYNIGDIIPAYDLFYVVEAGPCYMITSGTTPTTGQAAMSHTDGTIATGKATAGSFVIGVMDQTATTDTTGATDVVHVIDGLQASQAGT